MKRVCNIVFLTKIEHFPTVKSEHVYHDSGNMSVEHYIGCSLYDSRLTFKWPNKMCYNTSI